MYRTLFTITFLICGSLGFGQKMSPKKVLKSSNQLIVEKKWKETCDLIRGNSIENNKYSAALLFNLAVAEKHSLLLDSARFHFEKAKEIANSELKEQCALELKGIEEAKSLYTVQVVDARRLLIGQDFNKSYNALKKAFEIDTGNYESYFALGQWYQLQGGYDSALQQFNKALVKYISNDAQQAHVYEHIAEVYISMRQFNEALQACNVAESLDSAASEVSLWRGMAYYNLRKFDSAQSYLYVYLKTDSLNTDVIRTRANALLYLEHYNSAILEYNKVLQLLPDDPESLTNRGMAFYGLKNYVKAKESFNALNEQFKDNYYAENALANCEYQLGKMHIAIELYQHVTQVSSLPVYKYNLALAYHKNGAHQKALKIITQLHEDNKLKPEYLVLKIQLLFDLNNDLAFETVTKEAIQSYGMMGYMHPVYLLLADYYAQKGDDKKAREYTRVAHVVKSTELVFEPQFD